MSARKTSRARGRFIVRPLFAALVASGLAAPPGIQAATIQVTTGGDAGTGATCTLRQAIVAMNTASLAGTACANSGGAFGTGDLVDLTLQAGTIALAGATEIQIDVPLVINGPGASALTVSGAGASRVFSNNFGPPVLTLDVNNLTVANGKSAGPGGCVLGAGVVRLLNSVVTGCTALHDPNFSAPILNGIGGGIAAYDVRLTNSTVASNTAQSSGGGIFAKYATLDHSRVDNNVVSGQACNITQQTKYCVTAILGGGGVLSFGQVQMIHSTVSGNTVHASPISSDNAGPPPVTTTFNIGFGGGITQIGKYQPGVLSAATAKSTVFGTRSPELRAARRAEAAATRSKALAAGGPRVKADGYGDHILAMQSSTISGNRITGNHANDGKYLGGGAFAYSEYYNAEIANSTISGNSLDAAGEYLIGGALFVDSAEIYNSTITGNNGLAAIAFKYSPSGLAPPVAKSAMGPNAVEAARAAALVASVGDKLAALRGARGKAAVN
jgi:predicted outer membrane repeat protein